MEGGVRPVEGLEAAVCYCEAKKTAQISISTGVLVQQVGRIRDGYVEKA